MAGIAEWQQCLVSDSRSSPTVSVLFLKLLKSFYGSYGLSWDSRIQSASITLIGVRRQAPGASFLGAVAQLGERLICTQEVAGSIPTSSTKWERGGVFLARGAWRLTPPLKGL